MQNNPTISIIMPVYNAEQFLDESIRSILAQSFSDFELIIINDASTDTSKDIALRYASSDNRIKIIDNMYDKGLYGALNTGLDASIGTFVARADGDDLNRSGRLADQIAFFTEHPDINIVGTGYKLFGKGTHREIFHPSRSLHIAWRFLTNTYFCHPTVMFRRSILETINHYPPETCEDFAFFSKIIHKHKGANIPNIFLDYRQHETNYSHMKADAIHESVLRTYRENFLFYTGSLEYSAVFYNFHAKRNVSLRHLLTIIGISYRIAHKILTEYKTSRFSIDALYLYAVIEADIAIAVTLTTIRYLHRLYQRIKR
jgi:glycosyltransferase involved in cell wall biosynthesis